MIRKIEPEQLHSVWAEVREGLVEVQKYSRDGWLPEDVYAGVKTGSALLYHCEDGFFVITNIMQSYNGGRELHIWIAYGKGMVGQHYSPQVEDVARSLGCNAITFFSPRTAWERNPYGYKPVHTMYRKELA